MSAILRFDHVSYRYPGQSAPALDDVSLEIEPGELCLLAGLSAQGKSTLLRAACGLAPHFHGGRFAGNVTLAGMDTREHGPGRLGTAAGALFQDPEVQLVTSSVRAELALALESRGESAGVISRAVQEVALALGLHALLDRSVHELSGGEQQRVALAATLVGRPPVVLLDEPTSQLDPVAGDELIGLLRRLNEEWETTVLIAEHRLERCLSAAHRVIALHAGRVAHDGDPASFQEWAAHAAPPLQTPAARLFALAGLEPAPVGVRQARAALRARGLLPCVAARPETGRPGVADAESQAPGPADPSVRGPAEELARRPASAGPASAGVFGPAETSVGGPAEGPFARARARAGGGGRERGGRSSPRARARARSGSRDLPRAWRRRARRAPADAALSLRGVWHELRGGPAILRGVDLALAPGERVALMGANGAGKSTLLRHAAGLLQPTRGRVTRAGRVALLLQNPGDYLIGARVRDELCQPALVAAGLDDVAERDPRDLSGGQRQRLALAIVAGEGPQPAVLALDEPTRGMDREAKAQLACQLRARARSGQAVIVATHDPEFAAACAGRVALLADGRVIADGPAGELLAGGWYFATETARVLGGAGGALLPEQGAALLAGVRARSAAHEGHGTVAGDGATVAAGAPR
jgi:energy-coupling factor transport system ATP-binding protein